MAPLSFLSVFRSLASSSSSSCVRGRTFVRGRGPTKRQKASVAAAAAGFRRRVRPAVSELKRMETEVKTESSALLFCVSAVRREGGGGSMIDWVGKASRKEEEEPRYAVQYNTDFPSSSSRHAMQESVLAALTFPPTYLPFFVICGDKTRALISLGEKKKELDIKGGPIKLGRRCLVLCTTHLLFPPWPCLRFHPRWPYSVAFMS